MDWGRATVGLGATALQVGAMVATFWIPGLGTEWWHHVASLALVLGLGGLVRGRLQSRSFLGIGVLVTTVLATVSGFYLLYLKEGIRIAGYQDWGVFWHVAWSWAAAGFFFQHTWVNRVTYAHFFRRSLTAILPATVHLGLYALVVAVFALSVGPGKDWVDVENYIPLSYWTWLFATGGAYLAWWILRYRSEATQRVARAGVDLGLVPLSALAVLSGLPLLFLGDVMDSLGLKYASKFWHVAPSVLFAVLVFVHSVQLWNAMRAHWRKLEGRSRSGQTAAPSRA